MPEQVVARAVAFDPATDGFAFPNAFVNVVLALPNGARVTTAGRCGGMAYAALDYFLAGQEIPRWRPQLYAPGRVPPDGHWLARYIYSRLHDSFFTASAAKFVTWSLHSDGPTWAFQGVERWTTRDELPRLIASIDRGRPVVLGLVVARSLAAIGDNHQVVAFGYEQADGRTTVQIYDNNSPGRTVTLTSTAGRPGWVASNNQTWRGFFVQDYTPSTPRVLTRNAADPGAAGPAGAVVKLSHVWTGLTLHSHDVRYTHPGGDGLQQVTCFERADDNDRWRLVADPAVAPLRHGSVLRLRHVSTGRWLHSRAGVPSPVSREQEVSAVDDDSLDTWRVDLEAGGAWLAGSRVRLVHIPTGAYLHSRAGALLTSGQQEITAVPAPDDGAFWSVLEFL